MLVVVGLIGIALWLWMAQSNKAGKNWARIISTVFFAIDTIGAIGGLAGGRDLRRRREPDLLARRLAHRRGAIILLWQRSSTEYFKGAPRP